MVRQAIIVFTFSVLTLSVSVAPAHAALILNEALANEPGSTTSLEWVEVLNWPDTGAAITLAGYKYVDGGITTTLDTSVSIHAGGYAVLARKSTGASSFEERWGNASGTWGDHVSESYPLIAVSQLSLRNSSDTIRLVSPEGDTSTILWTSDAGDGLSVERVRPGLNDLLSNFAVCVSTTGTTPGAQNSVLPPRGDLAIDTVVVGPAYPIAGQPVQFAVRVINVGFGAVDSGKVLLQLMTESPLPIAEESFAAIEEAGEHAVVLQWDDPRPGTSNLIFGLGHDSNDENNGYAATIISYFDKPYLIVSEYLANPDPGGPEEWIEIANPSQYAISLTGMRIGDSLNTEAIPEVAGEIAPSELLVLAESEAAFRVYYPTFAGTVVQIPGWRALNNTGDGIRLIGPLGEIVDSLTFRATYPDNRSIERVEITPTLAAPGDWAASEDDLGATPGLPNSIQRGDPGSLIIDSIWLAPSTPEWGDSIQVYAAVSNNSFGPAEGWSIVASRDLDFTSPGVSLETIGSVTIPKTNEDESQIAMVDWANASPGIHRVHIALEDETGETVTTSALVTTVRFSQPLIIISEFMAAPTSGGPGEWIELYNASDIPISFMGVRVGDSSSLGAIPPPIPELAPGAFMVLAQDEVRFRSFYSHFNGQLRTLGNWTSLNDANDRIRVLGPADEVIDSLSFRNLTAQNRSIERRQLIAEFADPRDWGESIDAFGATPGTLNSIRRNTFDLSIDSVILAESAPNWPEAIAGRIRVANEGFEDAESVNLTIFSMTQSAIHEILTTPSGLGSGHFAELEFSLSGAVPGRHQIVFELAQDDNGDNNVKIEIVTVAHSFPSVIISEFCASPETNGPGEWVELYNTMDISIPITNCALGDSVSYSTMLPSHVRAIGAHEYIVVCERPSDFADWYPDFSGNLFQVNTWRELNNSGDKIRFRGAGGEVIDSLTFTGMPTDNLSRERLTLAPSFSDPSNWATSVDPSGATPGRANSVNAATAGPLRVDVTPNPVFRSAGQTARIDYQLEIGESLTLKIYDRAGRVVRTIADEIPSATGFVEWNGTDDDGHQLMPGPYVLLARSEPAGSMKKMVVVIAP